MTFEVESSLIVHFEQQAVIYSNKVAVKDGLNTLSYCEINNIANHVATSILSRQKSEIKTVALLLEPCVMMPSALLGVWKAGYIIVPINPSMPDERIKHILLDSKAEVIVTNNHNASHVNKLKNHTLSLINIDDIELENTTDNPEINQSEDLSACILYTSGSTGMPKGVLHNHQSLLHYTRWYTKSLRITNKDRLSLLFSYAFIPGLTGILRALLNGSSLCLFNPNDSDSIDLSTWLKQEKISILHTSPAIFRQFQDSLTGGETFPSIRFIQLGGDAISDSDVAFAKTDTFPNSILSYGLGSTETGPLRRMRVSKKDTIPENYSCFSDPVDDKEILILDENNKPVLEGEIGIIAVKSQYLAVGYWQQNDLTQQHFLPTSDSNVRIYLTGDYGCFLPDGSLLFLGRKDNQFNIKGYRIEAGEIECAMMSIPEVKQALVQTWETKAGQKQLVGYIVLQVQQQLTTSAIYQFLINKLPTYMVPSRFILLDEMPLSENGKILRQALPTPDITRPNLNTLYSKPRNSSEKKLAAIMGEILGIDKIGIHDNFFELGGDSLAAVGFMAEIEEQFGKVLPLAILFELGTIEQLVYEIEQGQDNKPWSPLVPIKTSGSKPPLFFVHTRGGNVLGYSEFISHMDKEQPVYGLQAFGVMKGQQAHSDVKMMAALYLQSIRTVQAKGPYFIGGHSFGGIIAFEMARQLLASGESIGALFVIDTWLLRQFKFNAIKYYLSQIITPFCAPTKKVLLTVKAKFQKPDKRPPPIKKYKYSDEVHQQMSVAHKKAQEHYQPETINCNMILVRAKEIRLKTYGIQHYFGKESMGWKRLVSGDIQVPFVDGGHMNLMHGIYAKKFARTIQQHLTNAQLSVKTGII